MAERTVSPELVLIDPVLAAEERARLAQKPVSRSVAVRDLSRDARTAVQPITTTARQARDSSRFERGRKRATWPHLTAVAVGSALLILLLDVRVDVGRTPASAGSPEGVPGTVKPTPVAPRSGAEAKAEAALKTVHPPMRAQTPVPRRFAWAPVAGADAYRVELFRDDDLVFVATSRSAEITVPARWTLAGKAHKLAAGEYRWYVWPIVAGRRAQSAVVQATLTVV
jgi:hypothetical protein